MNKTAIVIALIAAVLAAAWLYLWYNKDRYQYVPAQGVKYSPPVVFDKNTGTGK